MSHFMEESLYFRMLKHQDVEWKGTRQTYDTTDLSRISRKIRDLFGY